MKFLNKNQVKFSPVSFFVLREQGLGWEAFPKEICEANLPKPAKIKSFLIEKFLSPTLIKIKIFAGFGGRRQPTFRKRRAGLSPEGRQSEISVGILFKIGSNFVQKTPPFYDFGNLRRYCLALAEFIPHRIYSGAGLGLGKSYDFIGIFEIKKQFSLQNLEVRFAKGEHKLKNLLTNFFVPPLAECKSAICPAKRDWLPKSDYEKR